MFFYTIIGRKEFFRVGEGVVVCVRIGSFRGVGVEGLRSFTR